MYFISKAINCSNLKSKQTCPSFWLWKEGKWNGKRMKKIANVWELSWRVFFPYQSCKCFRSCWLTHIARCAYALVIKGGTLTHSSNEFPVSAFHFRPAARRHFWMRVNERRQGSRRIDRTRESCATRQHLPRQKGILQICKRNA